MIRRLLYTGFLTLLAGAGISCEDEIRQPECSPEGTVRQEFCDPDGLGIREKTCVDGRWAYGECEFDEPEPDCELGATRDCYPGPEGTAGKGICKKGEQECVDTTGIPKWNDCVDFVTPRKELCNKIDDDCDDEIDEDFPLLNTVCSAGLGECETQGKYVCHDNQDGVVCNAVPGNPKDEICNLLDDDCDGQADFSDGVDLCVDADGDFACAAGVEVVLGHPDCVMGGGDCDDNNNRVYPGAPEICDGVSNTCVGDIDVDQFGNPLQKTESNSCGHMGRGTGVWECIQGMWEEVSCSDRDSCAPEDSEYNIPCGTNIGECQSGLKDRICELDGTYDMYQFKETECRGEIPPAEKEKCNGLDETCTGIVDDGACEAFVPSATYVMGATIANADSRPPLNVKVDSFFIDLTEVSWQQYKACVDATVCDPVTTQDADNLPARITWDQAKAYCTWAGKRLPYEAEWEYAAQDDEGGIYPWGGTTITCDLANFTRYSTEGGACKDDYQPIDSYPDSSSPFGLLNVAGNAFEWCEDWYESLFYRNRPDPFENPRGPDTGTDKVIRGGDRFTLPLDVITAEREKAAPDSKHGFRCARSEE